MGRVWAGQGARVAVTGATGFVGSHVVGELLAQLGTQAEVVRLAGVADASTAELVRELLARVEGLDQVLDEGAARADGGDLECEEVP